MIIYPAPKYLRSRTLHAFVWCRGWHVQFTATGYEMLFRKLRFAVADSPMLPEIGLRVVGRGRNSSITFSRAAGLPFRDVDALHHWHDPERFAELKRLLNPL